MSAKVKLLFTLLCPMLLCHCVAVNRTPPLSTNAAQDDLLYGGTAFTSGRFQRPHEVMGIIQMNQEGYRTYLFGETNKRGVDPTEILRKIGFYVRSQGADGVQNFSLIMANPESEEVQTAKKVGTAMEVAAAIAEGDPLTAALKTSEGDRTLYFIKGELVRWLPDTPTLDSDQETEFEIIEETAEESEHTVQ